MVTGNIFLWKILGLIYLLILKLQEIGSKGQRFHAKYSSNAIVMHQLGDSNLKARIASLAPIPSTVSYLLHYLIRIVHCSNSAASLEGELCSYLGSSRFAHPGKMI